MMKRLLILGLLAIPVMVSGCTIGGRANLPTNNSINNSVNEVINNPVVSGALTICPDEKIVNKMPSIGGNELGYYILEGRRREIAEFDADWVARNCKVEEQTVY